MSGQGVFEGKWKIGEPTGSRPGGPAGRGRSVVGEIAPGHGFRVGDDAAVVSPGRLGPGLPSGFTSRPKTPTFCVVRWWGNWSRMPERLMASVTVAVSGTSMVTQIWFPGSE
jgi:hypothetical protein